MAILEMKSGLDFGFDSDSLNAPDAKIGTTLRVRVPSNFVALDGPRFDIQDTQSHICDPRVEYQKYRGEQHIAVVGRGNLFEMADLATGLVTENAALRERIKALEIENSQLMGIAREASLNAMSVDMPFIAKAEPLPQSETDRMWDALRMAAQS